MVRRSLSRFWRRRPPGPADDAAPAGAAPAPSPPPPFLLRYRSSTAFIVATICLAIFTDIFLYGLVVPVMPFALTARAGVAPDDLQRWNAVLLACYSAALFVVSPLAGLYADHTASRRLPLLVGLLALASATVLLCVGRSVAVYAVGRVLQGASAGVVWSVGLALLADTMGRRMGTAVGWTGIAMAFGLLLSPLVGGAVYAGAGYYAVYYVAFGLIVLDIALRLLLVEKKVARRWLPEEEEEEEERPEEGERPAEETNTSAATPPDSAPPAPAPPTPWYRHRIVLLLRSRRMLAALLGVAAQAGLMVAFDTVLPVFVKDAFGWGSTAAGLIFFAELTPPIVLSPLVGVVVDRWGAKAPAAAGFAAAVPVVACLRFVAANTVGDKVLLAVLLALAGTASTLANVALAAEVSFAIAAEEAARPGVWGAQGVYGLGYGCYTTAFALGSTVGSLMAGYLNAAYGWGTVTWALAVWCAVSGVAVVLWAGEWRLGPPAQPLTDADRLAVARTAARDEKARPQPEATPGSLVENGPAEDVPG